jgi:hypothetical protein
VYLLSTEEDPISFRLLYLSYDDFRVGAAVFSSDTWDWQFLPWVEVAPRTATNDGHKYWLGRSNQAGRIMYWLFKNMKYVLTLDTDTVKFSVVQLPACLHGQRIPWNLGSGEGLSCVRIFGEIG